MFIITSFPFADLRSLVAEQCGRLPKPDWRTYDAKGFIRGFGALSPRVGSSLELPGERVHADMEGAIRFPDDMAICNEDWAVSLDIVPWFRRVYFDGYHAGRFEIGFLVPEWYEDMLFDLASYNEMSIEIDPREFALKVFETNVKVKILGRAQPLRSLLTAGNTLGEAYVASTTSNNGLKRYRPEETIGRFFFVGDPMVHIRIDPNRSLVDIADKRVLTNSAGDNVYMTSPGGKAPRNSIIVQSCKDGVRNETEEERNFRVLASHLNSQCFATSKLLERSQSEAVSKTALRQSLCRLIEQFGTDNMTLKLDAAHRTFKEAYEGRVEDMQVKLAALSEEVNKPSFAKKLVDYVKGLQDAVITAAAQKAVDKIMPGSTG